MQSRTLKDFVVESNRVEGIVREPDDPQLKRELDVHRWFLSLPSLKVDNLEEFVAVVTMLNPHPGVLRRRVGANVRVGNHIAPEGGPGIEKKLQMILDRAPLLGPYHTHCVYETLHPFTDGNGRSGRVLWMWMMGGIAPLGFLHQFYYQVLDALRDERDEDG